MTKEDTVTSSSVPPSSPAIVDGVIPFNCLRLSQQSSSVDDDDSDNFFHHKFQEAENKLHHSYNDYSLACSFRRICSVEPNREQRSLFSSYIDNSTVDFSLSKNNNKDSVLVKKMMVDYSLSHMETNWLGKKALYLNNLKLCEEEIPISYIENLKQSLEKLSLSGNRLGIVPLELVESLSSLKTLDLSHCLLRGLPSRWNLPKLVHLNLSHNRLLDFPEQSVFEGLPNLQELNLYSNQISEIRLPAKLMCLAKLKHLDIGDNDFLCLPKRISQLPSLKSIGLCLNLLTEVPVELCNESFQFIDVSKNAGPNAHASTCERGLLAMMRCWKGTGHNSAVKEGHNGFCKRKRAVQASISFSPMISKKATRGLFIANSDDDTVREEEDPVSKAFHEKYQRTPRCQSLLLRK